MHNYVYDDLNFNFHFDFLSELYFERFIKRIERNCVIYFCFFSTFEKKKQKNEIQPDQLMGYADFNFIIFLCW